VNLYDIPLHTLAGSPASLGEFRGRVLLIVNVASNCGLTPQYAGLERLHERYRDAGFTVLGFPCNQFRGQEPGSPDEIAAFCSTTYGVTFPLFDKLDVNGDGRHPLYVELCKHADAQGEAGDVQWNFEKFLVDRAGRVVGRFRPQTDPESDAIVTAIEPHLDRRQDGPPRPTRSSVPSVGAPITDDPRAAANASGQASHNPSP
jgi:glutathione peroxidase